MYRIDNATASVGMPTPAAVGPNPNGYFTKGDPTTALAATIVDDDFLNALQEEICYVIEHTGGTLDKTNRTQLYAAISTLLQNVPYAASTTAANTYTASLSPAPGSYVTGTLFIIKFSHGNTGAATLNLNGLGAKNLKRLDGNPLVAGDIYDGMIALLNYDGTNLQVLNVNQQRLPFGTSSSAANTYTATLNPIQFGYVQGMIFLVQFTNTNTGAATLNINALGAKSLVRNDGTALQSGDIQNGMIAQISYDGTNLQLLNRLVPTPVVLPAMISSVVPAASALSLSNNVNKDVTSISIPAGTWDIYGNVFTQTSPGQISLYAWCSAVSATMPDKSLVSLVSTTPQSLGSNGINTPFLRVTLGSTTTYYLSCVSNFSASSVTACGAIYAVPVPVT